MNVDPPTSKIYPPMGKKLKRRREPVVSQIGKYPCVFKIEDTVGRVALQIVVRCRSWFHTRQLVTSKHKWSGTEVIRVGRDVLHSPIKDDWGCESDPPRGFKGSALKLTRPFRPPSIFGITFRINFSFEET
ncbi:hypothetical protein TNCV_691801 [Trichonephila clavipes]|nr:hypothetical protein TNCV_691801 [Trichonephila clavipes]